MTIEQLFIDAEAQISTIAGGATTLSNPSENWPSPFVQSTGIVLAGQYELDKKIDDKWIDVDIRNIDCDCLDVIAARTGDVKRTNKPTKTSVVLTGVTGTVLPVNTIFLDSFGRNWRIVTDITINNGIGIGEAVSTVNGEFNLSPAELYLQTAVAEITNATNVNIIEYGYLTESCEQFRTRLLNKTICAPETELTVIKRLENESLFVKLINDYPDCTGGNCSGFGFVIRGGDDTTLASIIRQYAPVNYINLVGNTTVNFDNCETVKFIRPCPVVIQIQYSAKEELVGSNFKDIVCATNNSLYSKTFNDLDITSIKFRTIRSTPAALACDDIEEGEDCEDTVSLLTGISQDCPCIQEECSSADFTSCAVLNSWEYPVFASAEYLGVDCD